MPQGAPVLAGQHPGAPHQFGPGGGTAPLPPASSPYPVHGQGLAGPGPHWAGARPEAPHNVPVAVPANQGLAFERGHAGHAEGPRAMGRSGMQDMRAGGPEPRPGAAPAPVTAQAMAQPHGPAFRRVEHGGRPAPAQPMPAQAMPAQPVPAPHMEAPHPHAPHMNAQAPHQPPAPRPEPAPRPQPAPQPAPQAPPHPQPAPPHQQAPAPHPEPAQAPPQQGKGGGHEEGKDHGHGHGH
jgi:hypothetical protein